MTQSLRPINLNRRNLTFGLAGGGMAAAMYHLTQAQDSATPEAATDTSDSSTSDTAAQLTESIARVRDAIAEVQSDRDAVASEIGPATVDSLLTQATTLVDDAEANAATGDASLLRRQVRGARGIAEAAQLAIVAQLTYPGLPSQESRSTRSLTTAYDAVEAVTEAASDSELEIGTVVSQAQTMYASAYDLHAAGAFAQAVAWARVADQLAEAGLTMSGDRQGGNSDGSGNGHRSIRDSRSSKSESSSGSDEGASGTPAAAESGTSEDDENVPPAPTFGS